MAEEYEQLLDKALAEMPEFVFEKHRFEIPKVKGHLQGNKTVISNFLQIADLFRRRPEHMLKYVLKELAAPGGIRSGQMILGSKIPASKINEKIQKYANEFVLCGECGKPDTQLEKEKTVTYLKCTACGAKNVVKGA
ncbi:TPA: translation initiation factor IF-2 subunit beta [Candidatus Woesearchaeota archaeon]|nr:translation initiation factor IF-2 subunit beta [Candidatus Woesearchaeota archaeon]HIH47890.1 translation initiation factor IF-2 subunit beta [Candidatus Woesearchaeota archaeon]HII88642.1 translation initiation factor IF-2 subunit beta [Candidatus Woesearchaeota archaeon]